MTEVNGSWVYLGERYRCAVEDCREYLPVRTRVWLEDDGTVFCGTCQDDRLKRLKREQEPKPTKKVRKRRETRD